MGGDIGGRPHVVEAQYGPAGEYDHETSYSLILSGREC